MVSKSTQCDEFNRGDDSADSSSVLLPQDNKIIDELKFNLKIKENLINSVNDSLVLKEAEIARLKTRIGLIERKSLINEMNETESEW
jgi:hypothetical protein